MRGRGLLFNTLALTASSLILRLMGLGFQIYLANTLGKEGIGLFHLILSVTGFAETLAISGVRFSTTRLVSEELGKSEKSQIRPLMRRCLGYAAVCGTLSLLFMIFAADPIGRHLIGDERTILSLRLLGLGLPLVSVTACLSGYFLGVGRPLKGAAGALADVITEIIATAILLSVFRVSSQEETVALVIIAGLIANIASLSLLFILYKKDSANYPDSKAGSKKLLNRLLHISVPLALAAYCRTALTSMQNALIPRGLRASGITAEDSLASYGAINGMAFPILTFPSVVFAAVSELIVPLLTEKQVKGDENDISRTANLLLRYCIIFSVAVAGYLWTAGGELGKLFYNDGGVGYYIRLFALLMPVMYMDHVTDGMLRGLGEHLYSMRLNIIDSLISITLLWFLLPRYAVRGYVIVLYASEIFNFTFSLLRLTRKARLERMLLTALSSMTAAVGGVSITSVAARALNYGGVFFKLAVFAASYIAISVLLGSFTDNEIAYFKKKLNFRNKAASFGYINCEPKKEEFK